jgi:alkanesulfonate monooxygenase SsuD/methylene tetrahydromethanopterin reductase-like flavin-dependent oxidoreductase (luciferase family)
MKVFLFDLLPYGKRREDLVVDGRLPWPFAPHFEPDVQVATYADHIDVWAEMERYGFDGVSVNEHHGTPYGMMNSPNLLAAALSQRTEKMKILILGNLLPVHDPLRLAEEIAMLDNMTNGRIICGVARGIPREYKYFNIPLSESRARFNEAFEIMKKAWTEDRFSHEGKFHAYNDISILPRPVQDPYPPVWVPLVGSKESIEWAGANASTIALHAGSGQTTAEAREDTLRYFANCLAANGRTLTSDMISLHINCYVADSKEQALEEAGPYLRYLFGYLYPYDQGPFSSITSSGYNSPDARAYRRAQPSPQAPLQAFGGSPDEMFARIAKGMPIGSPDEVVQGIVDEVEATGAGNVLLMCNGGAMPKEMFRNQVRRIGEEVLPRLQAYNVKNVPAAEWFAANEG